MIPLKFGLFWSGTKLSYLRYLTFVSLRKHHPSAEIELYISNSHSKDVTWRSEKQDFQDGVETQDFIEGLPDLGIKVVEADMFPTYAPNYQSDLFRWWWLYNNGGFYLDTDQIILKSFNTLPLDMDFIYSTYRAQSCGIYSPVGVIGSAKECPIVKDIMDEMTELYKPSDYNSLGPFMFRNLFMKHKDKWEKENKMFNALPNAFYPVSESHMVKSIYESDIHIANESYALHWFGGSPMSQEFNRKFTMAYASENHNDTITRLSKPLNKFLYGE